MNSQIPLIDKTIAYSPNTLFKGFLIQDDRNIDTIDSESISTIFSILYHRLMICSAYELLSVIPKFIPLPMFGITYHRRDSPMAMFKCFAIQQTTKLRTTAS
ncbi:hypothetical protein RF11_13246 [Thelohanellus kitauei]|uniref:Uncharacterized protein n=1 Tax=Thelohanellus kitauei TaxID=669202 RepID=A0A0C2MLZ4_THEKT|nr:hypothetical protein RF11_13246 [Thelohanellus kitauei]